MCYKHTSIHLGHGQTWQHLCRQYPLQAWNSPPSPHHHNIKQKWWKVENVIIEKQKSKMHSQLVPGGLVFLRPKEGNTNYSYHTTLQLYLSWLPYRKLVNEKQTARQKIKTPGKLQGFLERKGKKKQKTKKFIGYVFPVWSLFISNISKILEVSLLFQKRWNKLVNYNDLVSSYRFF